MSRVESSRIIHGTRQRPPLARCDIPHLRNMTRMESLSPLALVSFEEIYRKNSLLMNWPRLGETLRAGIRAQ